MNFKDILFIIFLYLLSVHHFCNMLSTKWPFACWCPLRNCLIRPTRSLRDISGAARVDLPGVHHDFVVSKSLVLFQIQVGLTDPRQLLTGVGNIRRWGIVKYGTRLEFCIRNRIVWRHLAVVMQWTKVLGSEITKKYCSLYGVFGFRRWTNWTWKNSVTAVLISQDFD